MVYIDCLFFCFIFVQVNHTQKHIKSYYWGLALSISIVDYGIYSFGYGYAHYSTIELHFRRLP